MIEIFTYESVNQVPKEWDSIVGDNIYMTTRFLSFMESVDDCNQRYYVTRFSHKSCTGISGICPKSNRVAIKIVRISPMLQDNK